MRLLDKLLTSNFNPGNVDYAETLALLEKAQLVIADDVVDFWVAQEKSQPDITDFPNVMLPFEHLFVEMRWASVSKSKPTAGVLLRMEEQNAAWFPGAKWVMHGHIFMDRQDYPSPVLMTRFEIGVANDGRVVSGLLGTTKLKFRAYSCHKFYGIDPKEVDDGSVSVIALAMPAALFAISFMHCRNVRMDIEAPPLKLSKIHEKHHKRPLLTYRVLKIDRMKEVLEREGHASSEGLKKALHTCRGHFKRYGVDGKGLLFGKHATTVWVPEFERGSIEQGLVVKDYEVC